MEHIRKIHGETNLAADPGACNVLPAQQPKIKTQAIANRVLSADQALQLAPAKSLVVGKAAVDFSSKGQPGSEVMQQRKTARVDMAAGGLNSKHAGAGVAGK